MHAAPLPHCAASFPNVEKSQGEAHPEGISDHGISPAGKNLFRNLKQSRAWIPLKKLSMTLITQFVLGGDQNYFCQWVWFQNVHRFTNTAVGIISRHKYYFRTGQKAEPWAGAGLCVVTNSGEL